MVKTKELPFSSNTPFWYNTLVYTTHTLNTRVAYHCMVSFDGNHHSNGQRVCSAHHDLITLRMFVIGWQKRDNGPASLPNTPYSRRGHVQPYARLGGQVCATLHKSWHNIIVTSRSVTLAWRSIHENHAWNLEGKLWRCLAAWISTIMEDGSL